MKGVTAGVSRLEVRGLVKTLGARRVLGGVGFDVAPGEVVGLLGPNGAGKTTALRIVMGFERADQGEAQLGDRHILGLPVEERARLGIGYLPQDPSIFPDLCVRNNLLIVLEALGRATAGIDGLLAKMGLASLSGQKAGALSGGERRRLEVARILALDPAICLLDEPFTGMDPRSQELIAEVVRDLRKRGRGVLLSDHNVRQAARLCDRITILDAGEVLLAGPTPEVLDHPRARERYLGDGFLP